VDRRRFLLTSLAGALAAPLVAEGQAGKVYRVGYLSAGTRDSAEVLLQAFLRALRELGWVEGQSLALEWRFADGKNERLPALATELVQRKVDVIVASAEAAALAAKNTTSSVPIVMIFVGDPFEASSSPAWRDREAMSPE
jgi:putative ABC transport system substrate-binding protein